MKPFVLFFDYIFLFIIIVTHIIKHNDNMKRKTLKCCFPPILILISLVLVMSSCNKEQVKISPLYRTLVTPSDVLCDSNTYLKVEIK